MSKQLGVCVPIRPLPGMAGYENPDKWGCLNPLIYDPLTAVLQNQTDKELVNIDFRDAYIVKGKVYVGQTCLSDLGAYFWYCEADRMPGSYHLQILKTLATQIPVYPDPWKWEIAVDKYTAHVCVHQAGVPVPDYLLFDAGQLDQMEPILEEWGAAMLKPRRGAWGKGVHLVENYTALRDLVGYIMSVTGASPDNGFLLERYCNNDMNKWVSVTVIGGEVMYGYRKRSSKVVPIGDGKFKVLDVNEKGGEVDYVDPSPEQREIALKAAKALDCPIIGFDMIWTEEGPVVVDENTSPGNYPDLYAKAGKVPAEEFARVILSSIE